jgi:hypothetical protein
MSFLDTPLHLASKLLNAALHGIDTVDQEAKRKPKLMKPTIVALHKTSGKLDHLDGRTTLRSWNDGSCLNPLC